MTKKLRKQHAKYHLGDMKMHFLTAVVSGVQKHLQTPTGNIVFARLNDEKKNEKFRNHILDEFAQGAVSCLDNIEHEGVQTHATNFQKKYLAAATKEVNKVAKQGEKFDHLALFNNTCNAFEKVHAQLVDKL